MRVIQLSGILDDLKETADGWKSKAEEKIKQSSENLQQTQEKLIKDLVDAADKKADEIASREAETAAETHARTLTKELRPYLIGTVAIIGAVGAIIAYRAVR